MKVVFLFSQEHVNFRLDELRGISDALRLDFDVSQISAEQHICTAEVNGEEDVRKLLSRSMLLKSAYFHMFSAKSYDDLSNEIILHPEDFRKFDFTEQSFSVRVCSIGRKKGVNCSGIAEKFASILPLSKSPVDLCTPHNAFYVLEEFSDPTKLEPQRLFFCRLIGVGQYKLKSCYDIKTRKYIGNTTMDPELAFIQSNITSVCMDDIVLDPFMGTGGLLLSAAEFGAYTIGTEINYQIAKAIGKSSRHDMQMRSSEESVKANFEQYGTDRYYLCGLLADACWHDLWARPIFNAIVADPPYGIREKGRKIGMKPRKEHRTTDSHDHEYHFPEKKPYSLEKTFTDLCDLAAKTLLIGGKLSFWFPVILESYSDECLPVHPALHLVANCEQRLSQKTSRRLLVYQKHREPESEERSWYPANHYENGTFRDITFAPKRIS
ncbi:tRNA guanosine-2'-O-methyltransferase TRM11 [Trichostrongylus colubriformis]|uniref:tRNA (guanine(10)-N(2))-methyltransferase TRMT11 n=1 Tax=Trichostrongylus colubriformis TaxID=6319 RepID=A0AAN8EYG1_TRICO